MGKNILYKLGWGSNILGLLGTSGEPPIGPLNLLAYFACVSLHSIILSVLVFGDKNSCGVIM